MNEIILYKFNNSDKLYCAYETDKKPSSYQLSFGIDSMDNCLKNLNYLYFLDQPDLYIIDDEIKIKNLEELHNYINNLTIYTKRHICNTLFKNENCNFSDNSTFLISSLKFNQITSEKLTYTQLLIDNNLIIPGTTIKNPLQTNRKNLRNNIKQLYNGNKVIKFPYSSSSKCVIIPGQNYYENDFYCPGLFLGYIEQPIYIHMNLFKKEIYKESESDKESTESDKEIIDQKSVGEFIEIRCLVINSEICLIFIITSPTSVYYFSPYEDIPEFIYKLWPGKIDEIRNKCKHVFNLINTNFNLNELFMRIDLFLLNENDKPTIYINEIEPFACGKTNMCLFHNCQLSTYLQTEFYINGIDILNFYNKKQNILKRVDNALKLTIYDVKYRNNIIIYNTFINYWKMELNELNNLVDKIQLTFSTSSIQSRVIYENY